MRGVDVTTFGNTVGIINSTDVGPIVDVSGDVVGGVRASNGDGVGSTGSTRAVISVMIGGDVTTFGNTVGIKNATEVGPMVDVSGSAVGVAASNGDGDGATGST